MTAPIPERHPDRSTRTEEAMNETEPISDKRLLDIGMVLEVTERPSLWHELYDEVQRLRAKRAEQRERLATTRSERDWAITERDCARDELAGVKAELADHLATECADAAAGQNAERAEQAEAALAEMRERHDVLGQTRAEIAIELRDAARWHPDNAAWTQDMDQAARIVEIGMDAYAAENGLPRLGGFILTSHCPWCGAPQQLDGDGLVPSHEHPVYFDECPGTHRRPADATPRTALERAADEQGDGGN